MDLSKQQSDASPPPPAPVEGEMGRVLPNSLSLWAGWSVRKDPLETHAGSRKSVLSKCSAWLCRRCPPALRVCLSEGCKTLTPLLLCGAALLAVVLYSLTDKLRSFVSRIFIPQYHFPYAVPLAFAQVLITLLALLAVHAVGLVSLKSYSLRLGERLLVPAVCGSAQAVLALWAEASAHSGLYPLTTRLLPLLCLGWGHALALPPLSVHRTCLLTAVTVTSISITASQGLYAVELLECLYGPLSLLFYSLSLAWLAKVAELERHHASPFDLYFSLMVNQSLVLGFLCLLHPCAPRALAEGSWHSLLFLAYLLAMLLLGAVQRLLVDFTALLFSPLSAALLHAARSLALPFYSLL